MPLHKAKTLFCIIAIAVGVLLFAVGTTAYWLASILVLGSALPGWELAGKAWKNTTLTALEQRRRAHATQLMPHEETSTPLDRADTPRVNRQ